MLFGMKPAPVESCRVLEVGCGDGGNLLPMAYALPRSRIAGVDLAAGPVHAAQDAARKLRLGNLRLENADLRAVDAGWGEFDYIIAHGVYSWTREEVRDGLLALCRARLAPQGIAFVSYNALPGSRVRQMLREMLLENIDATAPARARLLAARRFLRLLLESELAAGAWRALLEAEARRLLDKEDDALFHDDLAPVNHAVSILQFAAHAARHRLQYLAEAEPHQIFDHRGMLRGFKGSRLAREARLDCLKLRRFRQTLLCRREVKLAASPDPRRMPDFFFSGVRQHPETGGVQVASSDPAVRNVVQALDDVYPLPLPFAELVPYAGGGKAAREILFHLVAGGAANLHAYDFPCAGEAGACPRASALARYQAARSTRVTSLCHLTVELDDFARAVLRQLDGRRGADSIAAAVSRSTRIPVRKVRRLLPESLSRLAGAALLES